MDKINIELKKGQKVFFTSDCHFGHRNVIRFCDRPFEDEKDMAKKMIQYWNSTVGPDDIVISLGDFSWWTDRHGVKRMVDQLNGIKFFICGNHCTKRMYELIEDNFVLCDDTTVFYIRGGGLDKTYEIVCNHYPLLTWSHSDKPNCLQFFGHIHSLKDQPMFEFGEPLKLMPKKQYDVGVDRHDYRPVELREIFRLMEEYPYWDMH